MPNSLQEQDVVSPTKSHVIALIGSNGMLAAAVKSATPVDYMVIGLDLPEFDLTDRAASKRSLKALQPDVIINCAAFTNVDGCETAEEAATLVNGSAVALLAEVAKEIGATLVHISTDYVFNGQKEEPYLEDDAPNPQSAYGRSKLFGEQAILSSGLMPYFIIRTSWLYGLCGNNFVETIIRLAKDRDELRIVADQIGTPTYTGDLAQAIFALLETKAYGVYHFSNLGQCSWYEFAQEIIKQSQGQGLSLKVKNVLSITTEDYPLPAPRPVFSVLSKQKYLHTTGSNIPGWCESLKTYMSLRSE